MKITKITMNEATKNTARAALDSILTSAQKLGESALAGAEYVGKKALLTCEIEKHKCRLDKLYRAIGERVAAGSLSEKASGEKEPIFRLIDEAASEKQKIAALSEARDKIVFCRGR